MALIISDNFSFYNASAGAKTMKNWTTSGSLGFWSGGRWGANSYSLYTTTLTGYFTQTVSLGGSTTIVGLAVKPASATNNSFLNLYNGTNNVAVKVNASNQIVVYNGSSTIYHTVSSAIALNSWYYVELKVIWSATVGQIVLRLDGSQYYDSGATLSLGASTNTSTVTLGNTSAGANCYMTDLMFMDGTGATFNDFQGDVRIEALSPTGSGATQAWTLPNNTLLTNANQSRMITDTSGWAVSDGAGGSISRFTTGGPDPKVFPSYLYMPNVFGQYISIISSPNGTSGYPITPGQSLNLGCWLLSANALVSISARFYNGAGVQVGADLAFATNVTVGNSWLWFNAFSTVTAPVGSATCAVVFRGNANTAYYLTGVVLSTNATNPSYVEPSGDHYLTTGDLIHTGDLSYVSSDTINAKETYVMSDLQSSTGNIVGIRPIAVSRKESATARTLATVTRVGITDYSGASQGLPNDLTYQPLSDVYATNPATAVAWTMSEVNSLEAGMEIKS